MITKCTALHWEVTDNPPEVNFKYQQFFWIYIEEKIFPGWWECSPCTSRGRVGSSVEPWWNLQYYGQGFIISSSKLKQSFLPILEKCQLRLVSEFLWGYGLGHGDGVNNSQEQASERQMEIWHQLAIWDEAGISEQSDKHAKGAKSSWGRVENLWGHCSVRCWGWSQVVILYSHWSIRFTWPEYCILIG